jgi:hypothetical protein
VLCTMAGHELVVLSLFCHSGRWVLKLIFLLKIDCHHRTFVLIQSIFMLWGAPGSMGIRE